MTTTINLLPWREERRKRQQQDFFSLLLAAAILGGVIAWGWYSMVSQQVSDQQARNSRIEAKAKELDGQIKEIKELRARRDELVARMKVIQGLQGNRFAIVYVFDQLVKTLPDGVYYSKLERRGETFTINGIAENNSRIAELMRNLDESPWFKKATLVKVASRGEDSDEGSFLLTVQQSSPNAAQEEEAE